MKVKLYQPDIRVTLYKTIKRQKLNAQTPVSARFTGAASKIDLTPFLGEQTGLRTSKSVREPAGGFSIVLADKAYAQGKGIDAAFESLYGLIEPMDMIEIRMRHGNTGAVTTGDFARFDRTQAANLGGQPPIVMRGFVSNVNRMQGMSPDGKPSRTVSVSGQDFGKLWQMLQILYLPGYVIGEDVLSNFKLFERFGVGFQTSMKAGDFVTQMIEKIVNPYLATLMPSNTPSPSEVKLDISVLHGVTSVTGPQNQEGTIYSLLHTYGDVGIWNELFLEDREDGVYCVYRPNPYKSIDGAKIQDDAPTVPVIDILAEDVSTMNLERSDSNVANFYWVRGARFELVSDIYRKQFAINDDRTTVLLDKYPNCAAELYGLRVMYGDSQQGGDEVTTGNSGLPLDDKNARDTSVANWLKDRRQIMVDQNKDNVLLESGSIRVRGNEALRAGCFARIHQGAFYFECYVVSVTHDYVPFQGFFTTLQVERGMSFVERSKREGGLDSPYLAEMIT